MGIGLQSPFNSRERILAFGFEGVGKSTAILQVARQCVPAGAKFWIVDTDVTYDRLFDYGFSDLEQYRGNQILFAGVDFGKNDPQEWDDTIAAIDVATNMMDRDDWLVIDLADKLWQQVQNWYDELIFGQSPEDYLLALRQTKTRKKDGGGDVNLGVHEGFMDWPVINAQYHAKVSRRVLRSKGHLFWVAAAQSLDKNDDRQTQQLYGKYGARPQGQKGSRHAMQTVLAFGKKNDGTFVLESIKDRERELWQGEGWSNFADEYLVGTAGWKKVFVKDEAKDTKAEVS